MEQLNSTGQPVRYEKEFFRKDGTRVPVEIFMHVAMEDPGTAGYYYAFITDIRQRKQAEEALRESEERYRIVVETALDAIITIDSESRILFVNPAIERVFGYVEHELTGRQLTVLMPERYRQRHLAGMKRYLRTGRKQVSWELIEFNGLHKSGKEIALEISFGEFIKDGQHFFIGIVRDITERKRAEETIRFQARHDLLTGLPNREMFLDLLAHEIAEMQRTRKRLAVFFLDVDQFKNVNDSLGHKAGDAVIQKVAIRLRSSIREFDALARIGGDEFTMLLPLITDPDEASKRADQVLKVFKKPFPINGHELHLSASMGISLYPEDGENAESLIKNADIALHYAKDQGRNNYQFFNKTINIRTLERIIFENRLRKGVAKGELEVYYQPQQNIRTGEITGAEALVRWNHPDLGVLTPAQFVPLAEEIGLIIDIDQWVLRSACEHLKTWISAGHAPRYVTANLSARQFQQPGLAETIASVLQETKLAPESLGIEITETLAMQDTELTARNLSRLHDMGVKLLIDDFGTGYSSLSYLKKLPIHKLKIDRSFITFLVMDPDYQAIVNAVIAMAHILKLKVVAEGVETEEQASFLNSRNCDEMQGYLGSRPVPAGEFEKLLVSVSGNGDRDK